MKWGKARIMVFNNEKNVLILTTVSGFLCKFQKENVKILQKLGYQVFYATNTLEQHYLFDEHEFEDMRVTVCHVDIARSPYMIRNYKSALRQLKDIVKKYNIKVVHCHAPVGGILGRILGKYFREQELKIIYTAHGFHFYKGAPFINRTIYYAVEKLAARFTDRLIVINEEDYQSAQKFHLRKKGELHKIAGVGLDLNLFKPLETTVRDKKRRKIGIQEDTFFLLSVGELNENKNHEVVLKALHKMKQEGRAMKSLKYGICGEGFFREKLIKKIQEFGLEDIVILFGYQVQIEEIQGCADVSIFPTQREGLGMAALEALAMGVPVIAADNRGTREYMEHGKNGFVCEYDDVDGFIQWIDTMRNIDETKRKDMQEYARKSVMKFDRGIVGKVMYDIYSKL